MNKFDESIFYTDRMAESANFRVAFKAVFHFPEKIEITCPVPENFP